MLTKVLLLGTMECCLFTSVLFFMVLPKRERFPLRLGLMLLFNMAMAFVILFLRTKISIPIKASKHALILDAGMSLLAVSELFFYLILLAVFFFVCCRIRFGSAFYCAACAYVTQDFAYTVFTMILPEASHRGGRPVQPETLWLELLLMLLCNGILYRLIAVPLLGHLDWLQSTTLPLLYMLFVLFVGRILGTKISIHLTNDTVGFFRITILYDLLLNFSMLAAQILIFQQGTYKKRLALEQKLRQQEYRNFNVYRNSVETLRHKTHDLKHILAAFEQSQNSPKGQELFQELQDAVDHYDASVNTGNASLDALLTRVWSQCQQQDILWTCMADGSSLSFMDPFDLYIMLGNALDNAVECLEHIAEKEKRFLSVTIRRKHQLVLINLRNYCERTPNIVQGLPVTTKSEKQEHGYGMKSIQETVQKYDGQLQVFFEQHTFILNILLPIPVNDT